MTSTPPRSPEPIVGRAPAEPDATTFQSSRDEIAVTRRPDGDGDTLTTRGADTPIASRTPRLARGSMVGRFVVLDRLGAGGMGVVYAAYDPELDRKVAIKLVPTDESSGKENSSGATRLLREAQSMARLAHPNVVAVYDVGSIAGGVYVAMEHIDGGTLTNWLEAETRPWRKILEVFTAAARGIAAAHAAGLVHRDFKPDNVMIGSDGRVRVLDFGLARPAKSFDSDAGGREESSGNWAPASHLELHLTVPGTVMGTPRYMAPEQHMGRTADERSDIYSFSVALWEALYGARPFSGHSLAELATKVIAGEMDEPPKSRRVPRWLRAVLRRGMARDPNERFPDMTAVLAALSHDRLRRTRWIAAGGAVVVAIGFGALISNQLVGTALCNDADAVLAGVWDRPRKDEIESAFDAEGKTYTQSSWRNVETTLDAYADALVEMRTEACEASRVHGTQSDEVLGRRMACLDRRLQRFATLSDALAEGGTTTIMRAVEAAHGLPDLELCGDVEQLLGGVAPPDDPDVRAQVEAIRVELERIETEAGLGRIDGVLERIDAVVAEARATEYRPVLAEALVLQGTASFNFGKAAESSQVLQEALDLAETVGHDPVIAEASAMLVGVEGSGLNHFDVADVFARRATAVVERMGNRPHERVYLLTKLGVLDNTRGRPLDAAAKLSLAVELAAEYDEAGPQLLPILNPLASAWTAAERLDDAAAVLERARAIVDTDLGPEHPNAAVVLSALGRLRHQQHRYEEALGLHRQAREVFVAAFGVQHPNVAAVSNAIALALCDLGRLEECRQSFEETLAIAEQTQGPDHLTVAVALANLSGTNLLLGRNGEALAQAKRAVEIRRRKLGEDHELVASARDVLADALAAMGEHETARQEYAAASAIYDKLEKKARGGYGHIGIAKSFLAQGRAPQALEAAERGVATYEADADAVSDAELGEAHFTLARALAAVGGQPERVRTETRLAKEAYDRAAPGRESARKALAAFAAEHR